MQNYNFLLNKKIALIIENTEKQNDVKIFYGNTVNKGYSYVFTNENKTINLTLDSERLNRFQKVTLELKKDIPSLSDCEYFLWLKMEDLPNENLKENLNKTGINWNQ